MVNFKKRYLAVACSAIWLAGCNGGSSPSSASSTQCNPCTVFVTGSTYTGNLLTSAIVKQYTGTGIGVYAADYLCNIDESNPDTSKTFKAFITDGINRRACVTPNCETGGITENIDWVLHPNTQYNFINESPVFGGATNVTNSSGIYIWGTVGSTSPYTESQPKLYWTGFSEPHLLPWVSPVGTSSANCGAWSNSVPGNFGNIGKLDQASVSLQQGDPAYAEYFNAQENTDMGHCNNATDIHLLCVQQ